MGQLTPNYPPRANSAASADGLLAGWWRVLHGDDDDAGELLRPGRGYPWVTAAIFDRAVALCLADTEVEYLPSVGEFLLAFCHEAKRQLTRETLAALPPPAQFDETVWRDQRLALSQDPALAALIARTRAETRARLNAITAARAADSEPAQAGATYTVPIQWADGSESLVRLHDEDSARKIAKYLREHPWTPPAD